MLDVIKSITNSCSVPWKCSCLLIIFKLWYNMPDGPFTIEMIQLVKQLEKSSIASWFARGSYDRRKIAGGQLW